jgi:hypothetical protein
MSTTLEMLLIIWAVLTVLLVLLLIYRSTISMHQEDQLYLDEAEAHMAREQEEVHVRLNKLTMPLRLLGGASAALILVIAGMWVFEGLSRVQ